MILGDVIGDSSRAGCRPRFQEHESKIEAAYGEIPGASMLDCPLTFERPAPYYEKADANVVGSP